jgi:hypothetical protein
MKVGDIEVEQRLGEIKLSDLIIETSDTEVEDIKIDDLIPKMRDGTGSTEDKIFDIGVKSIVDLRKEIEKPNNFQPEPGIYQMLNDFDFYKVTLVAAFMPFGGLKFSRGMIRIDLKNTGPTPPAVHSIHPEEIHTKIQKNTMFGVAPDLQIGVIKPNIKYTSVSVYNEIHPQVIGYYSSESYAKWEYRTTLTIKEIVGSQTMELVVKQPLGTPTSAQARIKGELKWANFKTKFLGGFHNGTFSAGTPVPDYESFTIP